MVFSSVSFVFFFLTAVIALYFILPGRFRGGRNFVLLAFSLFFYACAGLRALPLLLFSVLLDWGSALLLPRCRRPPPNSTTCSCAPSGVGGSHGYASGAAGIHRLG